MNRAVLQAALSELEQLLREHEVRYAEVVRPLRGRVGASTGTEVSAEVLSEVRELFGGMGSLSDVYISRVNGHFVEDEAAANHELHILTQQLWEQVAGGDKEPK